MSAQFVVQSGQLRAQKQFESSRIDGKFNATSDVYLRNYIALVFIIFYAAKFSYILHNILYSCPPCCLSLSHSHYINLITFEMFWGGAGRATIENGFAALAMCSASFGQLLMVLSLCPLLTPLLSSFPASSSLQFARVARTAILAESAHH